MKPVMSLRNFTPSSTRSASAALRLAGIADGFHRLVHGHSPAITDTVMPAPADSMLPLSSIARLRIVRRADRAGVQS